jgi:hypothetical protein
VISGFRRDVDDICDLLGYYAALCGSSVPTFRDNLSFPSSTVKKFLLTSALAAHESAACTYLFNKRLDGPQLQYDTYPIRELTRRLGPFSKMFFFFVYVDQVRYFNYASIYMEIYIINLNILLNGFLLGRAQRK